nr:MAG TPA: hypothetical protein [Caudoviricetes sp.]
MPYLRLTYQNTEPRHRAGLFVSWFFKVELVFSKKAISVFSVINTIDNS